jgi:hypothetical protein
VQLPYAESLKSNASAFGSVRQWRHFPAAEVWAKFLLALVGLGLAFAAALFSTVSRDAGNLWATVILASISLLLATLVGLVTVPYLARRVAVESLRESFDFEVTRAGVVYVLVALVIGIAALNTGNNLLYIVVAAMLAGILVSGFVSALVLRGLELDVRLPQHLFAGRAVRGRIVLRNSRRFLPSFSIRVVPARRRARNYRPIWNCTSIGAAATVKTASVWPHVFPLHFSPRPGVLRCGGRLLSTRRLTPPTSSTKSSHSSTESWRAMCAVVVPTSIEFANTCRRTRRAM